MSIDLTQEQQNVIQHAIRSGWVHSVDEFISTALQSLRSQEPVFDHERAKVAGSRIRKLRQGVLLELDTMSFRGLAHLGHKY